MKKQLLIISLLSVVSALPAMDNDLEAYLTELAGKDVQKAQEILDLLDTVESKKAMLTEINPPENDTDSFEPQWEIETRQTKYCNPLIDDLYYNYPTDKKPRSITDKKPRKRKRLSNSEHIIVPGTEDNQQNNADIINNKENAEHAQQKRQKTLPSSSSEGSVVGNGYRFINKDALK